MIGSTNRVIVKACVAARFPKTIAALESHQIRANPWYLACRGGCRLLPLGVAELIAAAAINVCDDEALASRIEGFSDRVRVALALIVLDELVVQAVA